MKKFIFLLSLLYCSSLLAQDGHFSQFFNCGPIKNPSFAGDDESLYRINLLSRSQWQSIITPYRTFGFEIDKRIKQNGLGLSFMQNDAGDASVRTQNILLSYAFHFKVNANNFLSTGLSGGVYSKNINVSALNFESQYIAEYGFDPQTPNGEALVRTNITAPDANAGFTWKNYHANGNLTIAYCASHLIKSNQSFFNEQTSILPVKHNLSIMYDHNINKKLIIKLMADAANQGTARYRIFGVGVKTMFNEKTSVELAVMKRFGDAFIFYVGLNYGNYKFGISYDANASGLKSNIKNVNAVDLMLQIKIGKRAIVKAPKATLKNITEIADRDGDGIPDSEDQCPDEFGVLKYHGCPFRDSDGDGVTDDVDKCIHEKGPKENDGCPYKNNVTVSPIKDSSKANAEALQQTADSAFKKYQKVENIIVYFDKDKSDLKTIYRDMLTRFSALVSANNQYKILVSGHTDIDGSDEYNITLGNMRAHAVMEYLITQSVEAEKIETFSYGKSAPADANTSPEAMAKNRRVEVILVKKK